MAQNLFIDTHLELYDLNRSLKDLQDEYKFDIDHEKSILPINEDTSHSIFTNFQIEEFRKIWNKDPLH